MHAAVGSRRGGEPKGPATGSPYAAHSANTGKESASTSPSVAEAA